MWEPKFLLLCYVFSCKLRAWSGGNYWSDEFIHYAGHDSRMPHLLVVNMDTICWGKLGYNSQRTKQWTQPIPGGSSPRECGGRSSRWLGLCHRLCTVKPKASVCGSCQYCQRGGGVVEAIPALGQATRTQGVICKHATRTRWVICRHATTTWRVSNYAAFF